MTYNYRTYLEKVAVVKNSLGREVLHFIQTQTKTEQETCQIFDG